MCGLLGFFASEGEASSLGPRMQKALHRLNHRGPDGQGFRLIARHGTVAGLGHTRLAIIDLSTAGAQPMASHCGRYEVIYNGEIYNYKEIRGILEGQGRQLSGHSDTEVLVESWSAWGESCLQQFDGIFSFAIFDRKLGSLSLVRDAFGVKPLFVFQDQNRVVFSSEIPPLLDVSGHSPEPDAEAVSDYLLTGRYDRQSRTFFSGVESVQPGTIVTYSIADGVLLTDAKQWWTPEPVPESSQSFNELSEQVREALFHSVRLQLRSDVPVGIALSGGVDSSAIASIARYLEPDFPLETFSFVARGTDADEESWVDTVVSDIGARKHGVLIRPSELLTDLDDLILTQAEPFGSPSIYAQYRVYQQASGEGIKVILDGQGADELFAGYSGFIEDRLASLLFQGQVVGALELLQKWGRFPGHTRWQALVKLAARHAPSAEVRTTLQRMVLMGSGGSAQWITRDLHRSGSVREVFDVQLAGGKRRLSQRLMEEQNRGQLQALLRHADRNSMRWSVESRVPFLTTNIAKLVSSLPEDMLLGPDGQTKRVLRESMEGVVPNRVLQRRDKIGFSVPESVWWNQLGARQKEQMLDGLRYLPFVNAAQVRRDVMNVTPSTRARGSARWRAINLARWAEIFLGP